MTTYTWLIGTGPLLVELLSAGLELAVSDVAAHKWGRGLGSGPSKPAPRHSTHLLARLGLLEALGDAVGERRDAGGVEDVGAASEVVAAALEVRGVVGRGRVRLDRELWMLVATQDEDVKREDGGRR